MLRDLVILSSQYWGDAWFRKHHFAARFAAQGRRVLYCEPSHSVVRRRPTAGVGSNPLVRPRLRSISDRLHVLTPGQLLPGRNLPRIAAANYARMFEGVHRAAKSVDVVDPIVVAYDPRWVTALDEPLRRRRVFFEFVDDLGEYSGSERARTYLGRCASELCQRAAGVSYTSPELASRYPAARRHVVIPNGYDDTIFNEGTPRAVLPGTGPWIGFVGTLFAFLDYQMFEAVADAFPESTIVLVGRTEDADEEVRALCGRDNVEYLGSVPREEVPSLAAAFDVCIAPFLRGPIADALSPLKVYEYLALGKPVVCTPMAGVQSDDVGRFIDFADTPERFVDAVRRALLQGRSDAGALASIMARYTWDALFDRFRAFVDGEGPS